MVVQLRTNMGDRPHSALESVVCRLQQQSAACNGSRDSHISNHDGRASDGASTAVLDDWGAKMGALRHAVGVVELLLMVDQIVINKRRNLDNG
jgi:hypothetical protein